MGAHRRSSCRNRNILPLLPILTVVLAAPAIGCGGGGPGNPGTGPVAGESTTVVLLASSTANDQLSSFTITLQSLTLTDKSGKTVNVLSSPVGEEFIHLNGHVEPIATVSIPQDIYVSASERSLDSDPVCNGQSPGENETDNLTGGADTTVELANPITVDGRAMALVLNLQVSKYPGDCPSTTEFVTAPPVTATFDLSPLTIAPQPTNSANGLALGLEGTIGSIDPAGTGFTVNGLVSSLTPSWQVTVNNNTVFQGVSGPSQLSVGTPVDMDVAIQSDGSLQATRVEAISTDTTTLTVLNGPLLSVAATLPVGTIVGSAQQGYLGATSDATFGVPVNFSSTQFQTSGQLTNLASLPFSAGFDSANMVPGQDVTLTTQATAYAGGPTYIGLTTMTLRPQTINGTVTAISNEGGFTTYSVTLAPYDLFPQFDVQPGQTTLVTNPGTVAVYADGNTQMLNSSTVSAGGLFRFYGLVFNDNGTLRMDCAQVNDGVQE